MGQLSQGKMDQFFFNIWLNRIVSCLVAGIVLGWVCTIYFRNH